MKTKIKKAIAVLALIAAFDKSASAQVDVMANYIYTQDSIAGFDEEAASAGALADGFYGKEFKVFMYMTKRTFVKQKYKLKTLPPKTLFQNLPLQRPSVLPGGACNNEDFELATANIPAPNAVQGWTLQSGTNPNSCNQPNLNAVNLYTVYTSAVTDSRIPGTISSYFDASSNNVPAGNAFIRLNDDQAGAKAVRLSKAFIPTPTSALFQYAYIAVIEDGSHPCCSQAGFNIKVTVTNTTTNASTLLACPNISIAVPGAACSFTIPPGGPSFSPCIGPQGAGWTYANWTTSALDLTPYINSLVQIDVTVVDCNAGGHGGYFYFDAKCSPMVVTGNGTPFAAGAASVTVPTCGASGATICATPGLGPYSWAGPGVGPPFNTPSLFNQCFTSSLSATYTLYMEPPGSCAPIARIINTTITPAPLLVSSIAQAGCGGTVAVISLTPSGSAANPSTINWSPTPLLLNSQTTTATYTVPPLSTTNTVTVSATDPLGCLVVQTMTILPAAPYPTFAIVNTTGSPSITCATPSIDLSVQTTYTYGTLNYFWTNNSYTYSTSQINVTAQGPFTCIVTDPATNCQVSHVVPIGVNTVAPVSAISPSVQNITCALPTPITVTATANPSVNITHNIYSPFGAPVSASSHTMIYVPACGVYTHELVNNVNGCKSSKLFTVNCSQGFPTFNVTSPQNFTLGCNATSCAIISINNGNTDPSGGPVSYAILTPGSSSVTPSGPLSAISVSTFCAPGQYTVITKDNTSLCETRVPVSILQNTFTPTIDAIVERNILDCNHPAVTLKGISTTDNVEYAWNFNGNPGIIQGDTVHVITNSVAPTQTLVNTYTLVVTDKSSTCKSTSIIPIYQNLFPPKAIVSNGGTSALSCKTPSAMLSNQSEHGIPPGTPFNPPGVAIASWAGPSPQEPKINATTYLALTVGIYTMTVKNTNSGCISFTTITIADKRDYPILNNPVAPPAATVDCGDKQTLLFPYITGNSSAVTGLSYQWLTPPGTTVSGVNSLSLQVKDAGEYSIIVTNTINGCVSKANMEVFNGKLIADFDPDQTTGFAPLKVNFVNNSYSSDPVNGKTRIGSVWNFGNGTTKTFTSAEMASTLFNLPGTYTVTLFVSKGTCLESKQKIITVDIPSVMEIPNVFTPNNDGVNDLFFLKSANLLNINARIFDRWGNTIYEVTSETGNIAWDGKNKSGSDAAEGTYFYIIKSSGKDGQEYNTKGSVNLYR